MDNKIEFILLFPGVQKSTFGCVEGDGKHIYESQFNIEEINACFFYCVKNEFPYSGFTSKV